MLNPNPRIQAVPLLDDHYCWVIDDALLEPERWRDKAIQHQHDFQRLGVNAYPGLELRMPDAIGAAFCDYFLQHFRYQLGARRLIRGYARLALVTDPPERLSPVQWLPHRDRFDLPAQEMAAASVLYLFPDGLFGGTSFYRPKQDLIATQRLLMDAARLPVSDFQQRYGLSAGYVGDGNDWFERIAVIPPRFNRMICYDGGLFHCSDMRPNDVLSPDPTVGRLTLNGFFLCTKRHSD